MGPDVGALVRDEDGRVADQADVSLSRVPSQRLPLLPKEQLLELVEGHVSRELAAGAGELAGLALGAEIERREALARQDPQERHVVIVVALDELDLARQRDMDLVEVAAEAQPPVCRIMDFGKYKYMQARRQKDARKKQTTIQVKEVKLGPKTDTHDFDFKAKHVRRFLEEGNKAKVTVRFKGREMAHTELGWKMLNKMVEGMSDIAVIENHPRMEGRMLSMILSPKPH